MPRDRCLTIQPRQFSRVRRATAIALLCGASAALSACRRSPSPLGRPDGAAVVLAPVDPATEPNLTVTAEAEPNDTLANAQAIEVPASGGAGVSAALGPDVSPKRRDVDFYKLVVPPPVVVETGPDGAAPATRRRLALEVRPDAEVTVAVEALDEQGKPLVTSVASGPGLVDGIPNLSVIPGIYYVRVKAGPSPAPPPSGRGGAPGAGLAGRDAGSTTVGGRYRLVVRLLPLQPGEEIEPNGKAALATEIALGGDVAGYLGWRRDEDWFRFPLAGVPEGSVLSIDLDPVEEVAAAVALYDSVEHRLTEQRARRGERVAVRDLRLPPSEPHMFVVVRAETGRNIEAAYTLRLRTEQAKADGELEPNDDPAHAVPLADASVLGHLAPGDVDVYRYVAEAPVELDIEVSPPERVDAKLEILRMDGSVLTRVDSGKRREPERLPNVFVAAGTIFIRISAAKGDGNLDEPYRLSVTSRPAEAGAEREPNGVAAGATRLTIGEPGHGLIFPRGDVDVWSVPATPGTPVAISVRPPPGITLDVQIQNATGKEVARFRPTSDGDAPTRVTAGPEGCCAIVVREATGRNANPRDRYELIVTP